MQKGLLIYLIVMNLIGLAVMAMDKSKARHHAWRISEKTLFLVSILGGSAGTWAGMYLFHHKTKHWYFVLTDMHCGIDLENAWVWDVIKAWFAMFYKKQKNKLAIEYFQKVLYNEV